MEGRYGLYGQGRSGWTSFRSEEFQEEDVWAVLEENTTPKVGSSDSSSTKTPRRLSTTSRLIPRTNNNNNKISQEPKILQQSAPLNIPDWSKIYGKNSKKVSKTVASWLDKDDDGGNGDEDGIMKSSWDSDGDYDDDDDDEDGDDSDGNMMPPHEWLASKLARSQITSFSVCEGAGRTLKGRDLSRLRNAVLHRTGFLE